MPEKAGNLPQLPAREQYAHNAFKVQAKNMYDPRPMRGSIQLSYATPVPPTKTPAIHRKKP